MTTTDPTEISGMLWPLGVPVSQTWREIGCLLWIVQQYHLRSVVEVGVDQGGLGVILMARQGLEYLGVEKYMHKVHPTLLEHVIDGDALDQVTVLQVEGWLTDRRPALVFCDDGNKPKEVALYAPLLRSGDVLGTHDLGIEIYEPDLPRGPGWMRIEGAWTARTRHAFLLRL